MALKQELMASSAPAALASKIGFDTPNLTVAAAGSTQGGATLLTSNFSIVTSGGAGGVILNEKHAPSVVIVASGAGGTITVYPPVGGSINALAANTGFAVATSKQAIFIPAGLNWVAILSA
jgi:hypothetical protein